MVDKDIRSFYKGKNYKAYNLMGSHFTKERGRLGARFTVWAPNARRVRVLGDFNNWKSESQFELKKVFGTNLWSIFVMGIKKETLYKYEIVDKSGNIVLKSDPYARYSERRPGNASQIVHEKIFKWGDHKWIARQKKLNVYEKPINIYEIHLGSWKKEKDGEFLNYRQIAKQLVKYLKIMNYNYVEIMPIMEHPLDDSWGYQITGYYSVTSRYGSIQDFKYFVNMLHDNGIGVILDWVPGHFCKDEHGLYKFDGTPTYEYLDEKQSENKGWGAGNFDLGKPEVRSFLISNAVFWIKEFHIDGLRVDAVANTLYLDYDKGPGEWTPNENGGNKNIKAVEFYQQLNEMLFKKFPNLLMIAEESTAWPLVSRPVYAGGLGFNFKWNMGWMNDVLKYIKMSPEEKRCNHKLVTFSIMYNYSENFILPISHDEVVHGKKSLIDKMWGDYWNKFAGYRVFITYMYTHPGKKLIFMGTEFAQFSEWDNSKELEWELIDKFPMHNDILNFSKSINKFYIDEKALWELDYDEKGFTWIDANNAGQSILVFMRNSRQKEDTLIVLCNFTPKVYYDYNIGVPYPGEYKEVFNTDKKEFGGSGETIQGILYSKSKAYHNQKYSLTIKIPPMAAVIIKPTKILENVEEDTEPNSKLPKIKLE
ncbi:MAG: 1,4-alpha-glucan branching protein GlgB [Clostridium sp.]|uniref:1,4-alpha-glucan branching protein GlgB n=1 Tax=Clostridium sp. TaxID=1506 RepID=UPI0025BE4735|nr:1,4-alpha-glucan branching protein GlgB [Clostridium sp.]MCH3965580.1 1,4-alpha-glucan branching protein GlgB [Clostridium sp.]MCI1716908.1 1,4-alpha-glucan branching protein GlgB [Clostridium sp.]MCI1801162.1 1,4-alpha-glucan branching protein GlgB [Clostridium sp.]MCI1815094.1 1,4-alpha-glucan branching protein GlgB [Clostridium sp.]MCI1871997.1 1,4-alpha-glucan branching protein GlgB [Clostridium sp.]